MATLLDVKEDRVRLRKASGEVVTVPLERLSQADQQFVKERVLPPRAAEPSRLTIRCAGPVKLVAIPPDGSVFAAAIDSEWRIDLKVWDAKTGRERATIKSREFWGNPFYAFTHDGKWLVTGRSFLLWDAKTGREQPLRVDDLEEFAWRIRCGTRGAARSGPSGIE